MLKGVIAENLLEERGQEVQGQVDERQIDDTSRTSSRSNGITDEQLRTQLQAQGLSYEEFRKHARLELQKMIMIQKEVRAKGQHLARRDPGLLRRASGRVHRRQGKFKLAQILIAVPPNATPAQVEAARVKAEDVHKQLLAGANFGELARQYSDDDSKSQGGELGDFSPDDMIDQIQNASIT